VIIHANRHRRLVHPRIRSLTVTIDDTTHLASLGWDAGWADAFRAAAEALGNPSRTTAVPGRVLAEHRERYAVSIADGEVSAVLAGRLRHSLDVREDLPAVGDWVGISSESGDGTAVVRFVVPRRSAFVRKSAGPVTEAQVVAANVDVALIATALPGDLSSRRLERYLTLAWESGATPVVVLTKSDLSDDVPSALNQAGLAAPGVDVIAVSAVSGDGIDLLSKWLEPSRTSVLLGSSGVGKSTLVNRLLGMAQQRTAIVASTGKGRHTTTHRELVRLANGALLIDTPGMRELQLWAGDNGLDSTFADVDAFAASCRFRDCVHDQEPGCAVREAVASGELASERLEHWHRLRRELAFLARKQDERATAEQRARIRSLTRGVRAHLRRKYGDA
jgi:ribosome biogenesis GTPase / thiamine phosphate phosphatase